MLVRIQGGTEKIDEYSYKITCSFPVLYLNDTDYNMSLRMIAMDCNFPGEKPVDVLWSLSSTAVDKSAVNPKRQIATFLSTKESSYVFYEPSIKRDYKLQITSFHNSEFILSTLKPDAYLEIDFVEILLEFSRYARI